MGGRRPVPPCPRPPGAQETEGKPRHRGLALAGKDGSADGHGVQARTLSRAAAMGAPPHALIPSPAGWESCCCAHRERGSLCRRWPWGGVTRQQPRARRSYTPLIRSPRPYPKSKVAVPVSHLGKTEGRSQGHRGVSGRQGPHPGALPGGGGAFCLWGTSPRQSLLACSQSALQALDGGAGWADNTSSKVQEGRMEAPPPGCPAPASQPLVTP